MEHPESSPHPTDWERKLWEGALKVLDSNSNANRKEEPEKVLPVLASVDTDASFSRAFAVEDR